MSNLTLFPSLIITSHLILISLVIPLPHLLINFLFCLLFMIIPPLTYNYFFTSSLHLLQFPFLNFSSSIFLPSSLPLLNFPSFISSSATSHPSYSSILLPSPLPVFPQSLFFFFLSFLSSISPFPFNKYSMPDLTPLPLALHGIQTFHYQRNLLT